jgi:nitrite reductase/ring-hydroxylating ferredoxin subunit
MATHPLLVSCCLLFNTPVMSVPSNPSRRQFIKTIFVSTACSSLLGGDWVGTVIAEIQSPAGLDTGILRLTVSDFPALLQDFGSVRLGTSPIVSMPRPSGPRPSGLFYPVVINRAPGKVFYALSTECTHEGCVVPTFNATQKYIQCPCHGSRYAIDGKLLRGPAGFSLTRYDTKFDGVNNLEIEIPDMAFSVTGTTVQSGTGGRFKIEFLAFSNLEYEIRFRESFTETWAVIPFSKTPDGAATQTVLPGIDDIAVVYLDRITGTGFYIVTLRVQPV